MATITSAYANKVLKRLQDDKEFWLKKESEGSTYIAALGEEPVIPDYDYSYVSNVISEIDSKIVRLKHTINLINTTNTITVGDEEMSIDSVLVSMAQLNNRKARLDIMRKRLPKERLRSTAYIDRKQVPEFNYINYDLDLVKKEYEELDLKIASMQIALDKFNQTFEFEFEL